MFRSKLARAVFCLALGAAAFSGAPMRQEEIEELMAAMNRPKIAHQVPEDTETGDDLLRRIRVAKQD